MLPSKTTSPYPHNYSVSVSLTTLHPHPEIQEGCVGHRQGEVQKGGEPEEWVRNMVHVPWKEENTREFSDLFL